MSVGKRCRNCCQCELGKYGRCPMCQILGGDDEEEEEREVVFTNCNVCGRKLHNDDEESIGMCEMCANE